jgi:hypothetical protein
MSEPVFATVCLIPHIIPYEDLGAASEKFLSEPGGGFAYLDVSGRFAPAQQRKKKVERGVLWTTGTT